MEPDPPKTPTTGPKSVPRYGKSIGLIESVRRRFQSKDIGRQFWMPDSTSINCYHCATNFTAIRRRHHCRICGQIFCSNCCSEMIDSKLILSSDTANNDHGLVRVCRYCYSKLSSNTASPSSVNKLNNNPDTPKSIPEKGSHHLSLLKRRNSSTVNRKLSTSSIGDIVRYAKSSLDNASASIVIDMKEPDHDHQMNYNTVGPIGLRPASAASTGGGRFFSDDDDQNIIMSCSFDDVRNMLDDIDETITAREPGWVKEMVEEAKMRQSRQISRSDDRLLKINSNNSNLSNNNDCSKLDTPQISDQSNDFSDDIEVCDGENLNNNNITDEKAKNNKHLIDMEKFLPSQSSIFLNNEPPPSDECQIIEIDKSELPHRVIDTIYDIHSERILRQILSDEKMSLEWLPILNEIAKKISDTIKLPQYSYLYSVDNYYHSGNDEPPQLNETGPYPMDIRKRVKIKSILNGCKTDCAIVNGLVFHKNVAHRQMRTDIDRPRILLFACSVGYDERRRSQSSAAFKLTLFDSMRLQENDYITNLVAKIDLLKPDLIFAQGTISQTALELLRNKNITVVLNVKRSILERISFFTNAELVHSPEMILLTTKVGHCQKFRLQDYVFSQEKPIPNKIYFRTNKKTLMFLEGCLENIGCSVILRGSSRFSDFKKLKNVLRYMIFIHYNNRLEKAFHLSFNCIPIDEQCNSLAQLYQLILPNPNDHTGIGNGTVINNTGNEKKNIPENPVKLTIIDDCSDPLRSALNINDDDESKSDDNRNNDIELFKMKINSEKLEEILETIPLSSSPYIRFGMPFLMLKNIHEISSLKFYFPVEILPSARLTKLVLMELGEKIDQDDNNNNENDNGKDDDFINFTYLFNRKEPGKSDTTKLLFLNILTSRYMVVKPHPFLINNDLDFKRKSQQFIADFRANGPYLRYEPDFFTRIKDPNKKFELNESSSSIIEPLSNQEHQNISVLYSVFSLKAENAFSYCFKPKILDINYYGKNDMSLGSFLIRHFFFRQTRFNQTGDDLIDLYDGKIFLNNNNINNNNTISTVSVTAATASNIAVNRKIFCPNENCNISMFKHLMRFTHDNGTITVYLNKLNESRHVTMPHKILTWTYCTQCHSTSEYNEMSSDSLALSFGKFLELKFYGNRHFNYEMYFGQKNSTKINKLEKDQINFCRHSLHRDSYQFFSYDHLVVIFKYERIRIFEIVTPAPVIPMTRNHFSKGKLIDDLKQLTEQCHDVFYRIKNEIENIKSFATTQKANQNSTVVQLQNLNPDSLNLGRLDEFSEMLQQEELEFNKRIKDIHFKLSIPEIETANLLDLFNLENNVVAVKKLLAETVLSWNDRVKEFFQDVPTRKRNPSDNKFISSLMNRFLSNETGSPEEQTVVAAGQIDGNIEATVAAAAAASPSSTQTIVDDNLSVTSVDKSPNKLNSIIKTKTSSKSKTSDNESSSFKIFNTNRNSDEVSLVFEMPFDRPTNNQSSSEHYQLPTYKDIAIIVRDRDPGSIISYSMTTPEYEKKLNALKTTVKTSSIMVPGDQPVDPDKMSNDTATIKNEPIESKTTTATDGDSNQHIDIQFNDVNGKFFCCIYFAERFRKFRSLILVDGADSTRTAIRTNVLPMACPFSEDLYIHSLSNCVPWNAVGGKSGSTFLKTRDERFILKEVSKGEFKHFLTFACDYINYCERALLEKRPSAFVKVVGVYQISSKNLINNKGSIHYILVMENLFYEYVVSFIYDLKGSMRNRKIDVTSSTYTGNKNDDDSNDSSRGGIWDHGGDPQPSSSSGRTMKNSTTSTVLLDENLRQICIAYPLYVHLHSKIFLMEAIHRDSEFLKDHGVMDYSLLVGFDEEHQEYVVGIIDYVRLFNWEKILESRVKKIANAIDPTVVHPSVYQKRFLDAINDYFTMVPDKWYPFLQLIPLAGKFIPDNNRSNDDEIDSTDGGGCGGGEKDSVHQLPILS